MQSHASTAERIPILEDFYKTCLAPIAPVSSVLDLACGLNPLAIPWMPLAQDCIYYGCDIYLDMLKLLNAFFDHLNIKGWAKPCDLTTAVPDEDTQVAFLLKSIPCLEQVDKTIGARILQSIQADHILVSFPVHSLGGRMKGMPNFYRERFYEFLSDETWQVQEFQFKTELAFLVSK
jgi:16S rRNA (guanine(1405)-N(7))-methyltransferase